MHISHEWNLVKKIHSQSCICCANSENFSLIYIYFSIFLYENSIKKQEKILDFIEFSLGILNSLKTGIYFYT